MRDGRIVQSGTAEELILAPADPYVAAFTRDAPRARILSARAVMRPLDGGADRRRRRGAGEGRRLRPRGRGVAEQPFAVVEDGQGDRPGRPRRGHGRCSCESRA